MEYKKVTGKNKPDSAPDEFTVFCVGGEEWVFCPIRQRAYKVDSKPEEIVRQWWIYRLKEVYDYSFDQIDVEVKVRVGSTEAKKKGDIVVYDSNRKAKPRIFIEVKQPKRTDGIEQFESARVSWRLS